MLQCNGRPMRRFWVALLALVFLAFGGPAALRGSHTPAPTSVTTVGSFQSELGCPDDWLPDCATTFLNFDPEDDVWQNTFPVPAGNWQYKAALNNSWSENYGRFAEAGGANFSLTLDADRAVKFYYDHKSHWITDNVSSLIATVVGSFQSELGCLGDWSPSCLRSWLQDPDGDGTYTFTTLAIPPGNYEAKVAIDEGWNVNYGAGGAANGPNIPFSVPAAGAEISFSWNSSTHVLTISGSEGPTRDERLSQLLDEVTSLSTAGIVLSGLSKALAAKLEAAVAALEKGDRLAAISLLNAFVLQCRSLAAAGQLGSDVSASLVEEATLIVVQIRSGA
jgi:Pullulanase X25 domain